MMADVPQGGRADEEVAPLPQARGRGQGNAVLGGPALALAGGQLEDRDDVVVVEALALADESSVEAEGLQGVVDGLSESLGVVALPDP
jgi:hypothetical protein